MIDLSGKVALITGSSDGIGAATAILFSSLGAKVTIVGRTQSKLDKVASECQSKSPNGCKPLVIQADFEKDEDVKRTFNETINFYKRLDILVNNVGVVNHKEIGDADMINEYDRVFQINVRSYVILTQLAKDHLKSAKGTIINTSSIGGMKPYAYYWSYCMTKAAVNMFTKTMALALAPEVRVNSVNPGPIRTNLLGDHETTWAESAANSPLKRCGQPNDIAKLIVFLASDDAVNMTGANVISDAGTIIQM